MTYRQTLVSLKIYINKVKDKFGVDIPTSSWVNEAVELTEALIDLGDKPQDEYFAKEELLYDKTLTSLAELMNLNEILSSLNLINKKDIPVFLKKLKIVFKAPLLIKDETKNSSEGRNTMFELRLFSKLLNRGFNASLGVSHPDIEVKINENAYSIECKRIYKKETLVQNAKVAINQLMKYSLNKPGYGIVAISITRYFHSGDKRLEAVSEIAAKKRIEYEMDQLLNDHRNELLNQFPMKIPGLFLEFSDRVAADKAYTMNLIDIVETANGRTSLFHKVVKDFSGLMKDSQSSIV